MPANVLLVNRSPLHPLPSSNAPSSAFPDWQHYSPSDAWVRRDPYISRFMRPHNPYCHQTPASGLPMQMHTEFSPNQASVWTLFGLSPLAHWLHRPSARALPLSVLPSMRICHDRGETGLAYPLPFAVVYPPRHLGVPEYPSLARSPLHTRSSTSAGSRNSESPSIPYSPGQGKSTTATVS